MEFKYAVVFVEDVTKTMEFYEKAFGLTRDFVYGNKKYGQMKTGDTILSFASLEYSPMKMEKGNCSVTLSFRSKNVDEDFKHAIENGAIEVEKPNNKPWHQRSSYVKDMNGVLVEIASPVGTI